MPKMIDNVLSWASDIEQNTLDQAAMMGRMPFLAGHVALMPDAHVGKGSTVGTVIPTRGAIIPAAIGVDIGCGMVASETNLTSQNLPDSLDVLLSRFEVTVPSGIGQGHGEQTNSRRERVWHRFSLAHDKSEPPMSVSQAKTAFKQFGSLGSGNHFVEVCLDERDVVWLVLHSGSRGIGNQLATEHIAEAKGLMKQYFVKLEDPDLAYLTERTPEFDAYIKAMLWAQDYALGNRQVMMDAALKELFALSPGNVVQTINCHHNFTQLEHHNSRNVWLTRKGAIQARAGDKGIIPGSMGTKSYIVTGLGNPASYNSCAHGAGRRLSRGQAKKQLSVESFIEAMGDRTWQADKAQSLLDEHPDSYKNVDQVMADQADLVSIDHTLRQVLNYKGA